MQRMLNYDAIAKVGKMLHLFYLYQMWAASCSVHAKVEPVDLTRNNNKVIFFHKDFENGRK